MILQTAKIPRRRLCSLKIEINVKKQPLECPHPLNNAMLLNQRARKRLESETPSVLTLSRVEKRRDGFA